MDQASRAQVSGQIPAPAQNASVVAPAFVSCEDLFDPNQGIYLFYEMKSNKFARAVDDPGMIEKTLLQVDTLANWVERRLVTSRLMASVVATWLTAGCLLSGSQVTAAEVDAIGTPAPLGFADIVERVKPTVVGIRVKIEGVTQSGEERQKSPFPLGSPSDRYLRQFGIPHPGSSVSKGMAIGSGFFISGDGYVVTNNHVLANGTNPEVMTDNGTIYLADVIGADPETDLALIKVSAGTNFPYVRLARLGEIELDVVPLQPRKHFDLHLGENLAA